ncbi:MAG: hypothetical protein GX623_05630 [Clostridiales bacterium]|nr:hypothetical protein [Clostridiales bacterium]
MTDPFFSRFPALGWFALGAVSLLLGLFAGLLAVKFSSRRAERDAPRGEPERPGRP